MRAPGFGDWVMPCDCAFGEVGVRTGWNAAAACHQAGLAGTFGAMENSAALVTGASKGIGKEIARQLAAAGFGLYTSRSGVLAWKGAVR